VGFIAIRLARLGEKNERRRIGRLKAEGKVEKDKRIKVEFEDSHDVQADPKSHYDRLSNQKKRSPEKTSESFGLQGEPIPPEYGIEVKVFLVKPQMGAFRVSAIGFLRGT